MLKDEDVKLVRYLMSKGHIDKTRIEKFQRMMTGTEHKNCIDILIDSLGVGEEVIASSIAEDFNIPF